jgi:cell division protein FtsL
MRRKNKFVQVKSDNPKRQLVFYIAVFVFVAFTVFSTIQTATNGARLANLEMQEQSLSSENRELSDECAKSSSLTNIYKKADELGYIKPQNILYANKQLPVAQLP